MKKKILASRVSHTVLWCTLTLFMSCEKAKEDLSQLSLETPLMSRVNERVTKSEKVLLGRNLKTVKDVISNQSVSVLFVYNQHDCSGCIEIGGKIMSQLVSSSASPPIYTLNSSGPNINDRYLVKFPLDNIKDILNDQVEIEDIFLSVATPVFLVLDENYAIKDTFFPLTGVDQEKDLEEFLNNFNQ